MRVIVAAVMIACVLTTSVARADLEEGSWAPDIEADEWTNTHEPVSLYECKGMVVVLFFWATWWERGAEHVLPIMNIVNSEFGRSQGIFLVGLTDADLGAVQDMLDEERVLFPVGAGSDAYKEYDIESFPRVVVITPEGKVAWTGWPGGDGGGKLIEEIRNVIADTPPTRTHPVEAEVVYAELDRAEAALRKDNYRTAYEAANEAYSRALTGDPLKTRCQDWVDLIEALGHDKFARAKVAIAEKDFDTAITLLREIMREFRSSDVAQAASHRLRRLKKKYDEVVDIVTQRRDETIAENTLYDALALFRNRKFGEAYTKMEQIAGDFEDTAAADKALVVMERIRAQEIIWGYVRDYKAGPECRSLMSQAEAYVRRGRRDDARDIYRDILQKYPDTVWSDRARDALARLQ